MANANKHSPKMSHFPDAKWLCYDYSHHETFENLEKFSDLTNRNDFSSRCALGMSHEINFCHSSIFYFMNMPIFFKILTGSEWSGRNMFDIMRFLLLPKNLLLHAMKCDWITKFPVFHENRSALNYIMCRFFYPVIWLFEHSTVPFLW